MMRTISKQVLVVLFLSIVFPTLVLADFYVIPVVQKMKNVVTVAKSGGKFTDVKAAIDSISDANGHNPYLVYIGPGFYTVTDTIQLKAYVTVMGSGKDATILRGAISTANDSTSAIILGSNNATLTQLRVDNIGGNSWSVGIFCNSASPVLSNIEVTASGGEHSRGISNVKSSSPTMTNVTATASGSADGVGVRNSYSSPTMTNVTATASGGTDNYGVRNETSSPTMTNVTATASGGTGTNYGVSNWDICSPIIRNCTLEGTNNGVRGGKVVLSTVIGGGGHGAICNSCFDENGNALDATCN